MAFGRGFRGRTRPRWTGKWRRRISSKALPKSVAKKRRQWVTIWNEMENCQYNCLAWDSESCNFGWQIALLDPPSLGELFEFEPVTVVRQVGSIMLRPWRARPNPCDPDSWGQYQNWLRNHIHFRAGMVKQRTSTFEPSGTIYDPSNSSDWSEAPWKRNWEHQWTPRVTNYGTQFQNSSTVIGVCSNTTRSSYLTPATASGDQPSFTVPAIATSCTPVLLPEGCGALPFQAASEFPFYRLSLNSRRRIFMSESDRLDIWASMSVITADGDTCNNGVGPCFNDLAAAYPCNITAYTNYKILVEYG